MSSRSLRAQTFGSGTVLRERTFPSTRVEDRFAPALHQHPLRGRPSAPASRLALGPETRFVTRPGRVSPLTPVQEPQGAALAPPNRSAEADSARRWVSYCQFQSANSVEHVARQRGEGVIFNALGRCLTRLRRRRQAAGETGHGPGRPRGGAPDERQRAPARHFG